MERGDIDIIGQSTSLSRFLPYRWILIRSCSALLFCLIAAMFLTEVAVISHPEMVYAETYKWTQLGPGGGYISALAIDPSDCSQVYTIARGSIYRSNDRGGSWSRIYSSVCTTTALDALSLAIDPVDSSIIYAGTRSNGILKSTDQGLSWSRIIFLDYVSAVAIDPKNSLVIYAGTWGDERVYKSVNGGTSWTCASCGSGLSGGIITLAIDPINTSIIYASTSSGVFKSVNGGGAWTAINDGLPKTYVTEVAVDSINTSIIYAGTSSGVFKSVNGGSSWTAINSGLTSSYVGALAIDPFDSSVIYAGTDGGIFKTLNGGNLWTVVNPGRNDGTVIALAIDWQDSSVIYAGTDGRGAFKSVTGGDSWTAINAGLYSANVKALAIDPVESSIIYAGTASAGVDKSVNGGRSWSAVNSGLTSDYVHALAIDPFDSSVIYAGTSAGVFKTISGGNAWTAVSSGLYNGVVNALAIDPSESSMIYAGTSSFGVRKSVDGGSSWNGINSGLTSNYVGALAIDPFDSSVIYAGTSAGVFKTISGGNAWTAVNSGLYNANVTALVIDRLDSSTIYAGTEGGGVFKSVSGGNSWISINSGLPDYTYAYALVIDRLDSSTIYVGTNKGVYRSVNGGGSWNAINSGLTNTCVSALALDPANPRQLYAGTEGASVWLCEFDVPSAPNPISPINGSQLGGQVSFSWSAIEGAMGYELQVDNDCDFKSPEINAYLTGTSSSVYENYLADSSYCWRVRAKFADGSFTEWSQSAQFSSELPTAGAPVWVPLYRLYKGDLGTGDLRDHFYTTNPVERDNAVSNMGFTYERIECSLSSVKASGMVPLFRLYYDNGTIQDHFYTTNPVERDNAIASSTRSYSYEGIAGFVYSSPADGAVGLYRLFNAADVDHFYCTRDSERTYAVNKWAFSNEGIACYVMPAESPVPLSGGRPSGFYGSANTAIGAYTYSHTDLTFPSPGPAIRFERTYNSRSTNRSVLGIGWTHNYDWRIYENMDPVSGAGYYVVHRGSGRMDFYNHQTLKPAFGGVFDTLTQDDANTLRIITRDKTQYTFGYLTDDPNDVKRKEGLFLKEVMDRYGNRLEIQYAEGRINQVIDHASSRYITFAYDTNGNLAGITDPQLNRTRTYHVNGTTENLEWSKDWSGNQTTYTYAKETSTVESHRIEKITRLGNLTLVLNEYTSEGLLAKQTDALGNVTSYAYGADGVTMITDALGQTNPAGHTRMHTNNRAYALTQMTDTRSYSENSSYNSDHELTIFTNRRGNQATFDYTAELGNLTKTTHFIEDGDTITTERKYGDERFPSFANVIINAMLKSTHYEYDDQGNLKKITDPSNIPVTRDHYLNGQIKTFTDKKGHTTHYFYEDSWKNLTRVIDPAGGVTTYTYDAAGRRVATTNARGYMTSYEYDLNDNLVKTTDSLNHETINEYDANNNLTRTIDANGHQTLYSYDAKDQLLSTQDANGNSVAYTYDKLGRRSSVTDANGEVTRYEYDGEGNLLKMELPLATVTFEYDANGNVTKTVDARGKAGSNNYNAMDQVSSSSNPLGHTSRYTYRKDGNLFTREDANGIKTEYGYDDLGRLTSISYIGYPNQTIHFEYDDNGNLKKMTDPVGPTTYAYDDNDRLVSVTDPFGKTVGYAYDLLGNRTSIIYPGGKIVLYEYDQLNRLVKVTDWLGGATTYSYDAAGNLTQVSNPNGTRATYGYDAANRLISLTNSKADNSVICSYVYTLDDVGNITDSSATEPLKPNLQTGNTAYAYDDANRLTSDSSYSYSYDSNGNLVQRSKAGEVTSFGYNFENLLTSISGALNITNTYNGIGQRIARSQDGAGTRYVLDVAASLPSVIAETDTSGNVKAYYVHGIGLISRITPSGARQTYHFNNRGDAIALTDSSGNVTDAYAYEEFGQLVNQTGSTQNPFKFVGGYGVMEEGGGFYFMRARYYDAKVGKFVSEDTLAFGGGALNLYVYADNNPNSFIDPDGHEKKKVEPDYSKDLLLYSDNYSSDALHEATIKQSKAQEIKLRNLQLERQLTQALYDEENFYIQNLIYDYLEEALSSIPYNQFGEVAAGYVDFKNGDSAEGTRKIVMAFASFTGDFNGTYGVGIAGECKELYAKANDIVFGLGGKALDEVWKWANKNSSNNSAR